MGCSGSSRVRRRSIWLGLMSETGIAWMGLNSYILILADC